MECGAIIGGVSGGIITVIGYIFVTRWLNQKAEERKTHSEEISKLKTHFEDIENYIDSKILPYSRSITIKGLCMRYNDHLKVESGYPFEIDESYKNFKVHFRESAYELEHLHKQALELNTKLKGIREKITALVEQAGISFGGVNEQASQIIYDNIFVAFNSHWKEIKINSRSNIFERIEESQESGKPGLLYLSNWSRDNAIAYGKSNENRENCKKVAHRIATNEELEKEALETILIIDELSDKFKDFAKNLDKTIERIKKYEIGSTFNKDSECTVCKGILTSGSKLDQTI